MKIDHRQFEWHVMRHIDAAYNLARWILQNEPDAQDVVQESTLKAYKAFPRFQGADGKSWFLKIVRNGCFRHLERRRTLRTEELNEDTIGAEMVSDASDPEAVLLRTVSDKAVRTAIEGLPPDYREVIVMRELEGFAYSDIAIIAGIPVGTVMSRLSRGRALLARAFREAYPEVEP